MEEKAGGRVNCHGYNLKKIFRVYKFDLFLNSGDEKDARNGPKVAKYKEISEKTIYWKIVKDARFDKKTHQYGKGKICV